MRRPVELRPADLKFLRGRLVRVTAARLGGSFLGLVRRAGRRHVTVQRPGNPLGSTLSARCSGKRLRVDWADVAGVFDRRRHVVVPLAAWLVERMRRGG